MTKGNTMFDKIKDVLGGGDDGGDLGDLPLGGFEKYLDGVTYPIGVDDLVAVLRGNGAPDAIVDRVSETGQSGKSTFSSKEDVLNSIGGGGLGDKVRTIL
jgi:hypothetical protein